MSPYAFVPDQGHKVWPFEHAIGDDFDGCGQCYDEQHARGIPEERMNLCVLPRPVNPYALRPGTVDSLPCENCGHPAMYRLEALP